jgi:hypothetical protein
MTMDFSFTEAQNAVATLAQQIFKSRLTPAVLKSTETHPDYFHFPLWEELARAGLLGTALPESRGGSGHGFLELCALLEAAGAAVAPVPLWPVLVLGALPVTEFGTSEQQERLLPGVVSGGVFLSAALADSRSDDPLDPQTEATAAGSSWLLTGHKLCVPAAEIAQRIVVPARAAGGIGLFLLDPHAAGVEIERQLTTTGEPRWHMILRSARVDPSDVLAQPAHGAAALKWLVERATVGLCALELGVAERALRMTAEYTSTRKQFDRPIATFQAVTQRAADAYIDVEAIRLSMWQAAWRLSAGLAATQEVAMAKFWAAEAGHRVVYAAQHLHGGIGFDLDYPLHRHYTWSKQIELTLGSAPQSLLRIGAELAKG